MADSLIVEDFGQKVDLTRRIREVLLNYPEGTTVLKELIQNADDAGATKVCLCLDRRSHGTDSLLSENLAPWQGPALLAYNDSVFTEEDFASISRIGGSGKHGQAWKTGRFGVGFNSVYHLTDLPSFVSDKYVVLFDPQGVYLPNVSATNPGKRIQFVSSSAISLYNDQFSPFCAFGCDMKSSFPGTLFRLPLRNHEQAAQSKLSKQAYLEDAIFSMFRQLYEDGVFTLLFLKSVLSIEMYVWDCGVLEPRKLCSCSINLADDDIIWHRQAVLRLSNSTFPSEYKMDGFSMDFLSEEIVGDQSKKKVDTFYVVQTMASASSRIGSFAASASKDHDIHLLPWGAVAACISDTSSSGNVLKIGRAFCFLPLPVKTGMNVEVNGYFEVSSNRRGIWYGDDMDRSGRIRSLWNRLLLEDIIASSFIKLLLGVQTKLGPTKAYYSLWPTGSFEEPWNILVENIYKTISDSRVLHSDIDGGKWVSTAEAFLHDEEFCKSDEIGNALVQLGLPIVRLPAALRDMLLKFTSDLQLKVITPDLVRHYLRKSKVIDILSRSLRLILLEYCLEDLIDTDVGKHAHGLPLVPLANGDFGFISEASKGISYFICNDLEYVLLEKSLHRVVDHNISDHLLSRLSAIALSSTANIVVFNVNYFLQLFPTLVPVDWKYKSAVFWDPESNSNHPSFSWFRLFWQYLRGHCESLSMFGDWPLLPSLDGYLYKPSTQLKLLNVETLSKKMQDLLSKVGCKILDTSHGVEHPDLFHYVRDADGAGVLESVFDVISSNEIIRQTFLHSLEADERDELRQFLLDPKWYIGKSMSDSEKRSCLRLPIYRVYGGGDEELQYSDLVDRKYLPPLDCPESLFSGEIVKCSSTTEEEVLKKYYSIPRLGKATFYKLHVFGRIKSFQPEFRDSIMVSFLRELPQLCIDDPALKGDLRSLEFVPTSSGFLKCPSMLYDPRNEELHALLEESDSFPVGVFQEAGVLDMLQSLGMMTSVSPEAVVQSARQVERLMHDDQQKAHSRGKVLLSYLEVNALKWLPDIPKDDKGAMNRMFSRAASAFKSRNLKSDLEKFWDDLRMICWCPVLVSSPYKSLPWPVVTSMVAPPKLVRLYTDLWLVSASMRILDGECSSTALSYYLGWASPPGGSVIAAQLLELGKNNEVVTEPVLRKELTLAMPRIYSILMTMIHSDEMDIVKAVLEGCRWIWVGDGFATSDEVVINGPLHLAPYIRVIPVDLAVFKDLFLELGIREFLKPVDYANITCRMAASKGLVPLNAQELRAALLIAQHLAEVHLYEEQIKIFLPDLSHILVDATDLVYNDAPWLLGSEDADSTFGTVALTAKTTVQKFVHGNISNDVAEKLGVHSLRRMLLAESADSMNVSLSGAAEAFGQHEALTTRLKHILEMYADGPGTLFELVQNAEDARASEVSFLLDKTQYGTSSVLSREMADWQGPALYCFNDSVFSPQDLYAISRIGQESKLEKPFAIGRFGLGFNSVYHFTDLPTFVSGENIVMFDPHASNLPGISPSHPGLRIKFIGRKILEQFPDQFSPFLHFGCDMQHSFPGTLFRFPLRSAIIASRSQIKKEEYSPEDVLSLFSSFAEAVSETLLFLRNVKTISIFVQEGFGGEMRLLHRVHKQCISESEADTGAFQRLFNSMHGYQRDGMDRNQYSELVRRPIDTGFPWKCQKFLLTEKSPSIDKSHLWLTIQCLDSRHVKKNLPALDNNNHKLIPWACVASPLYFNAEDSDIATSGTPLVPVSSIQDRKNFEGHAFCFLPLPITTGLPLHVNAYFELSSNRRDIWFGNDMAGGGKKRSDWNIYLLEEVVSPACGYLLEKLAHEIGPSDLFFSFWPTTAALGPWALVVQKLYSFISDFGLRVLYTKARGGQWISPKQAMFPDFAFTKVSELVDALSDAGLPIVVTPKPLVEKFMEVCPSLHFLTPQLLRTLLIRRKREFRDRNAMILALEYCLLDLRNPVQSDSYYGLPLLPLSNGLFSVFEKRGLGDRIFVAREDEHGLLKDFVPNQLVDSEVPDVVHRKLCDMAQSENFNISFLTCHLLEKLFVRLLPMDWLHAKKVMWVPGHQGHPTIEWMRLLWIYLSKYCDDLAIFSKWPILPVGNDRILQLVENSYVIEGEGWSENLSSLLLRVGCLLLRHDIPIEHRHLNKYVQSQTASGILNALLAIGGEQKNIEGLFSGASEGELHEMRSYMLQSKWFSDESLNAIHIDIIKQIPMFESFRNRKLVSLGNPTKWLKPDGVPEDLLDDDFVRLDSEKERIILRKYLGCREPTRMEFYRSYVFNRMPEILSQQGLLSAILHEVRVLIDEDMSFKAEIHATPFVLSGNGAWQEPHRLYDPRIAELHNFLHKEAFFPSDIFSDPETLDALVMLGLRQSLGFKGLLDCARSVTMFHDSGHSDAVGYGRRLLAYLDEWTEQLSIECATSNADDSRIAVGSKDISRPNYGPESCRTSNSKIILDDVLGKSIDDMLEEEFWSELKAISWCPVYTYPPLEGLPWLIPVQEIAPPINVRPKSQLWFVSSMMHILDGESNSVYLQHKLGWMDHLGIDILSRQLIGLSKSYAQLKCGTHSIPDFEASLQEQMPLIYSQLQKYMGTDDFEILKASLHDVCWVWIGDDFVTTEALAFDSPVKYSPYLYVVPSELSIFRDLLSALGVRSSFDIFDYSRVLQHLQGDIKGSPLSTDQLSFVHCILEAVAECQVDRVVLEPSNNPLLIPDSSGVLVPARDLLYDDAPWMDNSTLVGKHFIHPNISHDLARKLGIQSLRCISLVSEEMTKDLPCMEYARICELLELYGNHDFLLFDLLELADCCKAKKLHIIFDKREHPCQSLLQQNLGDFQGPALIAVLEGATLSREEIASLQLRPPWNLRGDTLSYGLGLLSCYSVSDLPSIISGGYFYIFDPRSLVFSAPSSNAPAAKMFTLIGTNLIERFHDQFDPMLIGQEMPWASDSTVIRMPLSLEYMNDETEYGSKRITRVFEKFMVHGSRPLLFLKSVVQVSLSTWEEGNSQYSRDYLIHVESSQAAISNPLTGKKWKKFQLSNLFGTSNAAVKLHVVDINLYQGVTMVSDRWFMVLSLGSGQTRNMALDRRYLAYNLTPLAGVAAHIMRNGHLAEGSFLSSIMSPLPLSGDINIPVTVLGCFLVCHNHGRYLFKYQGNESMTKAQPDAGNHLIEAWNRELMSCVRDSYIRLVLEMQKIVKDPSTSALESSASHAISLVLNAHGNQVYSFWPRSGGQTLLDQLVGDNTSLSDVLKADWHCLIEHVIRPFYSRVVDLPVWQLYSGNQVKAEEGMFLSQPGNGVGGSLLPTTVCAFVKEHYPVFSVPWELVSEIQAVGFTIRAIKPKMVRDLLKVSSTSIVLRSVDTYVDVLEYCLSDIKFMEPYIENGSSTSMDSSNLDFVVKESNVSGNYSMPIGNLNRPHGVSTISSVGSGGDAIEMVASLGKALFDFGRGVVEDMGRGGSSFSEKNITSDSDGLGRDRKLLLIVAELKGLPCPTAKSHLIKLGSAEVWIGNKDEQTLMSPLAAKFIHPKVLDRPILAQIFCNRTLFSLLKLHSFSLHLLANNMKFLFHENWVNHVTKSNLAPWFSWESNSSFGGEGGPTAEWIRLFWKVFSGGSSEELLSFSDWPLIPAFLGRRVLCRVKQRHLIFFPPPLLNAEYDTANVEISLSEVDTTVLDSESGSIKPYMLAFTVVDRKYPWLFSLLNQCNIPIFDAAYIDYAAPLGCFPEPGQPLGQVIASKLVAAKRAGYLPTLTSFSASDCDELFILFVSGFSSNSHVYTMEDVEVLRDLPIYKTVAGTYTNLRNPDLCMIASNTFLKPNNELCFCYEGDKCLFLEALGVPELHDKQILVKFALPGFELKPQSEQEDILIYLYANWQNLQEDSAVIEALRETDFVRSADELSLSLSKPKDMYDPSDALLASVFSGERHKFPGERFATDGWLNILRKVGIRNSNDADVVLECAKRVEILGGEKTNNIGILDDFEVEFSNVRNEVSSEIWLLAETLVKAIFANFAVLYGTSFCSQLGKIACIPAEKGFPNVSGKKRVLCSYSEAVLLKDWPLAWSSAPILSRQNVVPPEYSWGSLQLRTPPAFPKVLKHLQVIGRNNGEDTLAHWPTTGGLITVEEASFEVLTYLDKVWGTLSSSDIRELQRVAFIPAANGTRLVTLSSLFVRLTINLSPFAFELPSRYLPFVKILKELGLQEMLSVACAKDLLLNLQKACGYQRLNPNELRAVMEILNFIYDETRELNTANRFNWESELIIPDDGCRLVHANSCIYIDSYGSRYVKYIDTSRLRFVHPDLSERLCTMFGIKKLSDVVVEEVDRSKHVQTLESIQSVSLAGIRQKLLGKSFQSAVWSIVNNIGSDIPAFQTLEMQMIQNSLESVAEKLQFVQSLYTRFILLPKSLDITRVAKESGIPEWESGAGHRALYFIDRLNTCMIIAEPPSYVSVIDVVVIVVSLALRFPISLPIGPLFLCPEDSEIALENFLRLSSDGRVVEGMNSRFTLLGREILPQDSAQVQFHPLRPFYKGEIVAWRSQNGEKLKYGRIPEDVRPSAGQALYRFSLEKSPGMSEPILSSHVFSFRSVSIDSESSSSIMLDENDNMVENIRAEQPESSDGRMKLKNQKRDTKEMQHGRVSAAELVQAVHEMLSAAGVKMDVEKQSLLHTTLSLQEQLKESQAALLLEQEKSDMASKEAETAKAAWLCRICLNNEVDITIVPCGHVLCRQCSSAISRCPFCRLQLSKIMKIYRP